VRWDFGWLVGSANCSDARCGFGRDQAPKGMMETSYRNQQYGSDAIACNSMAIIAFVYMGPYLISDFTNKLASHLEYTIHGLTLTNQHHHDIKDGTSTG
jgi:hypothetical protein